MITPQQAAQFAEQALVRYVRDCDTESPEDIRKVLEMLVSKAARGIEKYSGSQTAVDVLVRTTERILTNPSKSGGTAP